MCAKHGCTRHGATYRNPWFQGQTFGGHYSLALKAAEPSSTKGIVGPKLVFEPLLGLSRTIAAWNLFTSKGTDRFLQG